MFAGKTVWITGASSGIGAALAQNLAAQGARLILSARRADKLEMVKQACVSAGAKATDVHCLPLDVTDDNACIDAVAAAEDRAGPVWMLINNAGISQRSTCLETDMATYRKLFDVDVFGQIALTKALLPRLVDRGEGHIVITASVAGKIGAPLRTGYCAAKHAVMGFFDSLRSEVDEHGIKVTTITPGFIRTGIADAALTGDGSPYGKTDPNIAGGMAADACARVIVKGLKSGKPEIAVGTGLEMHALWIKRFFPRLAFKLASAQKARAQ